MKYGFDIDGTITAHPREMAGIMKALVEAGHEVHVITGHIGDAKIEIEVREQQLARLLCPVLRGVHYQHLHSVEGTRENIMETVGKAKGCLCRDLDIEMMFENEMDYIRRIRAYSPRTACLEVRP